MTSTRIAALRRRLPVALVPALSLALLMPSGTVHASPVMTAVKTAAVALTPGLAGPTDRADAPAAGCDTELFAAPVQVTTARAKTPAKFDTAANGASSNVDVADLAADPTAWFDTCGKVFFVDPALDKATQEALGDARDNRRDAQEAASAGSAAPYSQTFTLNSLPGSKHTIYLDFDGGTVTGTAWNNAYGNPITVTPYNDEGAADTNFTNAELDDIQDTWVAVAADYEPFDVNVTTQWPGQDAITRTSAADLTYGSHAMITNAGPIFTQCGCAGVAYIDVFDTTYGHAYYQPAWVFADGTGHNGKGIAEAASHEVGHNFGLEHDGITSSTYYVGSAPWAPIMGSAYNQPVSQWSNGDYAGADNGEDDTAIIAAAAPYRGDDHGNTVAAATPITPGVSAAGLISTRTDLDAFTFTGSGATTINVGVGASSNLDTELMVRNGAGTVVATVNPQVTRTSSSVATGLGATWTGTLPGGAGETYSFTVDGAGNTGTGLRYSDYASLGTYEVNVSTTTPGTTTPIVISPRTPHAATRGAAYERDAAFTTTGGTAPYTYTATGLPAGMSLTPYTTNGTYRGDLLGTPTQAGTFTVTVTATDSTGTTATGAFTLSVNHPNVTTTDQVFDAVVAQPFTAQVLAADGDGTTYTFTALTPVPAWLTVSSSGALSGTPTAAGSVSFDLRVTSANTTAQNRVQIDVTTPAGVEPLTATATSPPDGVRGTSYPSATPVSASGGKRPYTYTATGLPTGMVLSSSTGALSGTPTRAGGFAVNVTVTDATSATSGASFPLLVNHPAVNLEDQRFTVALPGSLEADLRATGGDGATYAYTATTAVPAWVTLAPNGALTGSPAAAGVFTFNVQATSGGNSDTAIVRVEVSSPPPSLEPVQVNAQQVTVFAGQSADAAFAAAGGNGTYTWEIVTGRVPTGMQLTASGHLVGTTNEVQTFKPVVKVTSGAGDTASSATTRLVISVHPKFRFTTKARLTPATVGKAFTASLATAGAYGNVTWRTSGQPLPKGLRFVKRGNQVLIKGRPTARGTRKVVVRGLDEAGRIIKRTFVVSVKR